MPCFCGDYCCSSCGPAQGNWKCEFCSSWASDGCRHIRRSSQRYYRRYAIRLKRNRRELVEQERALTAQETRDDLEAKTYMNSQPLDQQSCTTN